MEYILITRGKTGFEVNRYANMQDINTVLGSYFDDRDLPHLQYTENGYILIDKIEL